MDVTEADALDLELDEFGEDADDLLGEDDGYEWMER